MPWQLALSGGIALVLAVLVCWRWRWTCPVRTARLQVQVSANPPGELRVRVAEVQPIWSPGIIIATILCPDAEEHLDLLGVVSLDRRTRLYPVREDALMQAIRQEHTSGTPVGEAAYSEGAVRSWHGGWGHAQ